MASTSSIKNWDSATIFPHEFFLKESVKYLDETYTAVYEYMLYTYQTEPRTLYLYKHKEHWSRPSKTHGERCEVATWEISDDVLLNGEYGDTCHIE